MSFEGYYRILCKNGHLSCPDVYDYAAFPFDKFKWQCPDCGELAAFEQLVDQTNNCDYAHCELPKEQKDICKDHGCGYTEFEIKEEAIYETCNLGYKHLIKPATYKIPKGKTEAIESSECD